MRIIEKEAAQINGADVKYFRYCGPREVDDVWMNPYYLPVSKGEEFDVAIDTKKKGKVFVFAASTGSIMLADGSLSEQQVALSVNGHCDDGALLFHLLECIFKHELIDIGVNGYFSAFQVTGFDDDGNMRLKPVNGYQHTILTFKEI